MKFTLVLCRQHLTRMTRKHWYISGKRVITKTNAQELAEKQGLTVVDGVEEFVKPKFEKLDFKVCLMHDQVFPKDETNPDYKLDPCYVYGDKHALLEGMKQAQVLTNTILVDGKLPDEYATRENQIEVSENIHKNVQQKIQLSCMFDAEQRKLPKRKDPERPAWNFPRDYGITDVRKNKLLGLNLSSICEQFIGRRDLSICHNAKFSFPIRAHGKQISFDLTAEVLVTSTGRIAAPRTEADVLSLSVPDIYPVDPSVSLKPTHFYDFADLYPMTETSIWKHCHTALFHFNATEVKNLYDLDVTPDQGAARLMLKAFCVAACEARKLQQGQVVEPVTVQVVQSDTRNLTFGVYQLNTLDVDGSDDRKNIFWITPPMPLYSTCSFLNGRPVLEGYNPLVINRLMSFMSTR